MSKILYACSRNGGFGESIQEKLHQICDELVPDNIKRKPEHMIRVTGHLAYAVTMSSSTFHESGMSILLGVLYEDKAINWSIPNHDYPDGNYALFRNGLDELETVSDASGSRTIWYYHDEEIFIASSSQRAIIMFLGSFLFDERVIPWILSTGSLGPRLSWDKRLQCLQADSSLLLNKSSWKLSLNEHPIEFRAVKRRREEHKEFLAGKIRQTIRHLQSQNLEHWIIPLSGGFDSRAILCFIKEQIGIPEGFKAVTWGLKASLKENNNDAKIAKELAESIGVEHEYYLTDTSSDPIETVIDRFLLASEGRVDHLTGYMDGMTIWRRFQDDEIAVLIRGDEGFGWIQVWSDSTVRRSVGCGLCADYENLKTIIDDFGLPSQQMPAELERESGETLYAWRDRLYHAYRIPTILAALSDIKFTYVELINPLCSSAILTAVRSLPDKLRNGKSLYKEIVNQIGPDVPFATKGANATPEDILSNKSIIDLIERELTTAQSNKILGKDFIAYIIGLIERDANNNKTPRTRLKHGIKRILPRFIRLYLRSKAFPPSVDNHVLVFRVFIIIKMYGFLQADARKLRS